MSHEAENKKETAAASEAEKTVTPETEPKAEGKHEEKHESKHEHHHEKAALEAKLEASEKKNEELKNAPLPSTITTASAANARLTRSSMMAFPTLSPRFWAFWTRWTWPPTPCAPMRTTRKAS